MTAEPTRVYVTVDVECAEERLERGPRGALRRRAARAAPGIKPAMGYDLRVWGRFENQRDELGIPLLMTELESHGFRGTFFVEPFGAHHFGKDGLAKVCRSLRARGHDVQLHAHPIQRRAAFRSRGEPEVADDIGAYSLDGQEALLREGVELLVEAGAQRTDLLAFRAGNFGASNETWRAMANVGLRLSSNYDPCYFGKNCRMRWDGAEVGLFESPEPGVWELPITCFVERPGGFRHLQIAAVSTKEAIECLWQCRALGVREVVLVTHSFELYTIDGVEPARGRSNAVNLRRFREVLAFLGTYRHDFAVETVGALAARLPERRTSPRVTFPHGRPTLRALRVAEQLVKRASSLAHF